MNDVISSINQRVSLRKFSDVPVTEEHKHEIINSALRAPTAGNLMFYSIIKIEDKETLKRLSVTCDNQPFIQNASFALIFVVDYQKLYDYLAHNNYFSYCKEQDLLPEFPELSDLLLGAQDAMCAAQNAVIAAESLNVGSCYIGDILENFEIHKELLRLEKLTYPLSMLVFGYYPTDYKKHIKNRYDKKFVVFNEKYKRLNEDEIKEMFGPNEKNFNPNNTLGAKNYAQMIYGRKIGGEFSIEMRRSAQKAFEEWISYKEDQMKFY